MAASKGPCYAAREDPTLPKPWRALVDGNTGFLYFWNPLTNVTQYEKPNQPLNPDDAGDVPEPKTELPNAEDKSDDRKEQEEEKHEEHDDRRQQQVDSVKVEQEAYNMQDVTHGEQMSNGPVREHGSSDMGSHSSAEAYRRQHEITVTGEVPHPFTTFESTGFPPEILREVLHAGFSAPTPIQAQSWPIALKNRDIVAVAKTGSGKTLGYLIPGFIHLMQLQNDSKMGPRVLVLSPTRELATQIHDEAEKFGKSSRISSVYVEVITPMEKRRRLEQILRTQEANSKILVFCSTKRMCDQLARILTDQFGAAAIHGDKSQSERDSTLSQFRNGMSPVLVATDVAARGLDIKDIRVVVNYDFPTGIEDYVHRIGRTGRAGATGVAYTFFCDQDSKYASDLVKILEGASQRVPPELRNLVSRCGGYGSGGKFRRWSSDSEGSYGGGRGSRNGGDSGNGGSNGDGNGSRYGGSFGYGGSYGSGDGSRYGRDSGNGGSYGGGTSNNRCDDDGDNKSSQMRNDDGPVWSHDRLMAAGASVSQKRLNSGIGNGGSYGGGTSNNRCDDNGDNKSSQMRNDDGPVWSHDRLMAAGAGASVSQKRLNSGTWASGNRSRSRSPSPNVGPCKW